MGEHGIYEKLADYLNSMPIGAPKTPELFEILKTLYTEEEAELAVKLPFLPMTLDALADRTGIEESALKPVLNTMVEKGLVFEELGADEPLYRLLPTVVGFSETPFWAGRKTAEAEKLAPLWLKYVRSAFYNEVGGKSDTPMTRVIPMQDSIDDPRQVAPYEKLAEKVKETSYQAVAHCPCSNCRLGSGIAPRASIRPRTACTSAASVNTLSRMVWAGKSPLMRRSKSSRNPTRRDWSM